MSPCFFNSENGNSHMFAVIDTGHITTPGVQDERHGVRARF